MIFDFKTGRIAYHSLRFREDGGTDFVQFDFNGKELYRYPYRRKPTLIINCENA